jgi:hypothetical protein
MSPVILTPAPVGDPANRTAWTYARGTGTFAATNSPRQWVETTPHGAVYTFNETQRNASYIELHDASRNISVRLYANSCTIARPASNGRFDPLYTGSWTR